jgi:hypothetical protein
MVIKWVAFNGWVNIWIALLSKPSMHLRSIISPAQTHNVLAGVAANGGGWMQVR